LSTRKYHLQAVYQNRDHESNWPVQVLITVTVVVIIIIVIIRILKYLNIKILKFRIHKVDKQVTNAKTPAVGA